MAVAHASFHANGIESSQSGFRRNHSSLDLGGLFPGVATFGGRQKYYVETSGAVYGRVGFKCAVLHIGHYGRHYAVWILKVPSLARPMRMSLEGIGWWDDKQPDHVEATVSEIAACEQGGLTWSDRLDAYPGSALGVVIIQAWTKNISS